ncbi:MAG: glycerophosphoryl diester phosphodiesterase membrane domain-containing protein [Caldilineaceae bacterium]
MQSPIFRSGPLSLGDLMDWAIRIYRARFGKLILTTALFLVPVGIVSGIITGQTMTSYLNFFLYAVQNPDSVVDESILRDLQNSGGAATWVYLLMPVSLALNGIATLVLTQHTIAAIHSEELGVGEGIRRGSRRFWAWLGMQLSVYLVYLGVLVVLSILFFMFFFVIAIFASAFLMLGSTTQGAEPGAVAVIGMVVGIFCLYLLVIAVVVAPFIYLAARWAVATPGIVEQGWGPIESLQRSWELTRGHVRRCIGYTVVLALFYGFIYASLMLLASSVSALVLTTSTLAGAAIMGAVGALLPVLWQPLAATAYVMLYYDLRMRNQGYDLELRIQQLEAEVAGSAPALA